MYVTPRTLLGIIRLSQAMAKLNFRNEVTMNDVDESLKLMDFSFRSLRKLTGKDSEKRNARNEDRKTDTQSEIMHLVHEICNANKNEPMAVTELYKRLQKRNASI
jgi:DNA replication licensing factor MCM7